MLRCALRTLLQAAFLKSGERLLQSTAKSSLPKPRDRQNCSKDLVVDTASPVLTLHPIPSILILPSTGERTQRSELQLSHTETQKYSSHHLLPLLPPRLRFLSKTFLMLAKEQPLPESAGLMVIWEVFQDTHTHVESSPNGQAPVCSASDGEGAQKSHFPCCRWAGSTAPHSLCLSHFRVSAASIWPKLEGMNTQFTPSFGPPSSMAPVT